MRRCRLLRLSLRDQSRIIRRRYTCTASACRFLSLVVISGCSRSTGTRLLRRLSNGGAFSSAQILLRPPRVRSALPKVSPTLTMVFGLFTSVHPSASCCRSATGLCNASQVIQRLLILERAPVVLLNALEFLAQVAASFDRLLIVGSCCCNTSPPSSTAQLTLRNASTSWRI